MTCQSIAPTTMKFLEEIQAQLQSVTSVTFADVEYQAEKLVRKLMGRPNHCSTLSNYVTGIDSEGYHFGRQKSFRFRLIPDERGYPNSVLYDYIITSGGSITRTNDDPYAVTILNDLYYVLREDEDIVLPPDCYSSSLIYEAIKREMFDLPLPDPKSHLLTPSEYEPYDLWKILRREVKWGDLNKSKEEAETKPATASKCARMIYEILGADSKDTILKWKQACGLETEIMVMEASTAAADVSVENQAEVEASSSSSKSLASHVDIPPAGVAVTRIRQSGNDDPVISSHNSEGIGREDEVDVGAAVTSLKKGCNDNVTGKIRNDCNDKATTTPKAISVSLHSQGGNPDRHPPAEITVASRGSKEDANANRSSIASIDQDQEAISNSVEGEENVLPKKASLKLSRKGKCYDRATATTTSSARVGDPHPPLEMTVRRESDDNATATAVAATTRSSIAVAVEEVQGQLTIPNPEDDLPSSPTSTSSDGTYSRNSKCLDQHEILSMLEILDDDEGSHLGSHPPPESVVTPTRKRRIGRSRDSQTSALSAKVSISGNLEDEENEVELFVPVSPLFTPTFHFSDGTYHHRFPASPSPEDIIQTKRSKSDEKVKKNIATEKVLETVSPSTLLKGKMLESSSVMDTLEGQGRRGRAHEGPKNSIRPQKRKSAVKNPKILELSSIMNTPEQGQNAVPLPFSSLGTNGTVNRPFLVAEPAGGNVSVDIEEGFRHARGTPTSFLLPVKLVARGAAGPSKAKRKVQKRMNSVPRPPAPVQATRSKDASESEMEDVQVSEEEEDEKSVRKSKEPRPRTYRCLTGKREDFKPEEEYLIVQKICEAKAFLSTRTRSIYQDMAKTKDFKDRRTWVALYDRFRKFIAPQLERLVDNEREIKHYAKKCGISLEDLKELLKGLEISNKHRQRRQFFTPEDDYLIVRKICEVKAFLYTGGLNLFNDMAKSKDFDGRRTGKTLRNRFKRFIRPKLLDEKERKSFAKKCGISSDDMKELLEGLQMSNMNSYRNYAPKYIFD